ncbi:MAG: phenylalanine--tRNA ligase subunit beta, partial [Chitinophagaceae bacterium]
YSLLDGQISDRSKREKIAQSLAGMGFSEIITNSITNSKYYPDNTELVHMLNSLSSELDVMRPSMLETGLEVVSYNLARRNKDLCLFEHGSVYKTADSKYEQSAKLAIFASGDAQKSSLSGKAVKANGAYLKSVVDNLLALGGIDKTTQDFSEGIVSIKWKNKVLCSITEVPAQKLLAFDIKERVWYAEIDWALFTEAMSLSKLKYSEVPKYPMVQRDLALVLDKAITYAQLQKTTDKLKLGVLKSYSLFDIFENEKLGADKKSMAMSYYFQLNDRTLTDVETEALMEQLKAAYTKDFNAQIRN